MVSMHAATYRTNFRGARENRGTNSLVRIRPNLAIGFGFLVAGFRFKKNRKLNGLVLKFYYLFRIQTNPNHSDTYTYMHMCRMIILLGCGDFSRIGGKISLICYFLL